MNQKGFTLVEILLYLGLSAIILLVSSSFFVTLIEARAKHQVMLEVNEGGVQVMQIITQSIRDADAITLPVSGTGASSLTLDVTTVANDPTIIDLLGTQIQMTEGTATAVPLTSDAITASGLTFTNLSRSSTPGVVRVQFTLTHVNPSGRNAYTATQTFYGTASLRQP